MITIDPKLKGICPNLKLGIIKAEVKVEKENKDLWKMIDQTVENMSTMYLIDEITEIPEIKSVRDTYKQLGKEPSRYRGSAEALIRRILQGKGLYKVNNVVDINNLISVISKHPVGSYDLDKISESITFGIGQEGQSYKGIGKEEINISGLPVFIDENGAYGSPTSDSERAMITLDTKNLMMVIIAFSGTRLDEAMNEASILIERYAFGKNISKFVVD